MWEYRQPLQILRGRAGRRHCCPRRKRHRPLEGNTVKIFDEPFPSRPSLYSQCVRFPRPKRVVYGLPVSTAECWHPAASMRTPSSPAKMPDTSVGVARSSVSPRPSWQSMLLPKENTFPESESEKDDLEIKLGSKRNW